MTPQLFSYLLRNLRSLRRNSFQESLMNLLMPNRVVFAQMSILNSPDRH